mgnify:CR=1 FL=1
MVVISVTVTASVEQVVAGIPRTVSIATNIPASIFYTLDGSVPTLFSNIYTGPIFLPTDKLSVTLNILATNGVDSSLIVSETYITNMAAGTNLRVPHAGTTAQPQVSLPDAYPFGNPLIEPNATFVNAAEVGITVLNPALPSSPTGFDGAGNPNAFTNQPYDSSNYNIKYSTTDSEGQTGIGVGNLPNNVKITQETPPPDTTNQNSNLFDPRAMVIFQDASTENPNDPAHINRMHFSLENLEKVRDGNHFYTSGLDAPPVSGSFLRAHYNPRTNMMTYYYLDTWANKWIISTAPYSPTGTFDGNLSGIALSKRSGAGFVFEWRPFARRVLF